MKRMMVFCTFMFCSLAAWATPTVVEQPYSDTATGKTVSVSNSVWTLIGSATALTGRSDLWLTNDEGNASNMALILSTSSVAPSEAITVKPGQGRPGITCIISVSPSLYLWAVYLGGAPANAHYQEHRQGF